MDFFELAVLKQVSTQISTLQTQIDTKAAKGANSDITSLSGLTAALSVAQGGTGVTTVAQLSALVSSSIISAIHPVGHILITTNSANPATYLGVGTWSTYGTGRTLVGIDTSDSNFNTVDKTGGEKTHQLTTSEMPSHQHSFTMKGHNVDNPGGYPYDGTSSATSTHTGYTDSTGGNGAHNNLQPYIVCYMWKRTA